jgi:pimeloyl-ACP methyl ester carboxylesterase
MNTVTTDTVTSKDGTSIAFDRLGNGPSVILVAGALGFRSHATFADLAARLARRFTVYNYDRRGRGDSGDTAPYAVQREVEDIDALIDAAGGSASLYGLSSGAVLGLEAGSKLPTKVRKLALYEPPFIVDDSRPPVPKNYVRRLDELIAAGRRGDAVEVFLTDAIRIPAEFVAEMRNPPAATDQAPNQPPPWAEMEKVAHTLAYDGRVMGDTMSGNPLPTYRWTSATSPTLVITGGNSEAFFHNGARALVGGLPDAKHRILDGQDHNVDSAVLAPVLDEFFAKA